MANYPQYYKRNDYKVECDICGRTRKRSQCRLTWDKWLACISDPGCWYPKHPLDSPPPVILDGRPVKDARPISTTYVYVSGAGRTWETCFYPWESFTETLSTWNNV